MKWCIICQMLVIPVRNGWRGENREEKKNGRLCCLPSTRSSPFSSCFCSVQASAPSDIRFSAFLRQIAARPTLLWMSKPTFSEQCAQHIIEHKTRSTCWNGEKLAAGVIFNWIDTVLRLPLEIFVFLAKWRRQLFTRRLGTKCGSRSRVAWQESGQSASPCANEPFLASGANEMKQMLRTASYIRLW